MATRKSTRPAKPSACGDCKGTATVTVPVFAGRGQRRRQVAQQDAMCLTCLGSGTAPTA